MKTELMSKKDDIQVENCPKLEKYIVEGRIQLIKIWLDSSDGKQRRRFEARKEDLLHEWKPRPMDLPLSAGDMMLKATGTTRVPWHILHPREKKRARLNCLHHTLSLILC